MKSVDWCGIVNCTLDISCQSVTKVIKGHEDFHKKAKSKCYNEQITNLREQIAHYIGLMINFFILVFSSKSTRFVIYKWKKILKLIKFLQIIKPTIDWLIWVLHYISNISAFLISINPEIYDFNLYTLNWKRLKRCMNIIRYCIDELGYDKVKNFKQKVFFFGDFGLHSVRSINMCSNFQLYLHLSFSV